jgi:predicted RNA polymerase sigma factor
MDSQERFSWFITENAIPHAPSAWAAWSAREREIAHLRAALQAMHDKVEHLEQHCFELEQRQERLKLVHSAA